MKILKNVSLKKHNTFGIDAKAKFFCKVNSVAELQNVIVLKEHPNKFFISGGSNMLLTKDIDALVVKINIEGKEIISQSDEAVIVKVMAGENWHNLVLWAVDNDYGGMENMSLIPGNAGTAPIQNIGAYGVELKDIFVECEAMEISSGKMQIFTHKECKFGYRDSFFKNEGKGKYIITSITLQLTKKRHQLKISYGAITSELEKNSITQPTIKDVSNAVISIRRSKLPDPAEIGNSGSFFKNPVVSASVFNRFIEKNSEAPFYKISETEYKIPAGWLIEQCGYKGKRYGDAGVHKNQALVLVNYGDAKGSEILELAFKIQASVLEKFEIEITPEVNIIK